MKMKSIKLGIVKVVNNLSPHLILESIQKIFFIAFIKVLNKFSQLINISQ